MDYRDNRPELSKGVPIARLYGVPVRRLFTASDLEQLLIARLIRAKGGSSQTWQRALGKVIVRDVKLVA